MGWIDSSSGAPCTGNSVRHVMSKSGVEIPKPDPLAPFARGSAVEICRNSVFDVIVDLRLG